VFLEREQLASGASRHRQDASALRVQLFQITQENQELREILQQVLMQRQLELAHAAEQLHADADSTPVENFGHADELGLPRGVGVENGAGRDETPKARGEERAAEDEDEEKREMHAVIAKLVEQNSMLQTKVNIYRYIDR
jgi:hypothetical protein